jgi:hypothetical protein
MHNHGEHICYMRLAKETRCGGILLAHLIMPRSEKKQTAKNSVKKSF